MKIDRCFLEGILGLTNIQEHSENFSASCPFAKTNHKAGEDKNPSFYIHKITGVYHCFACQEKGSVLSLTSKILGISSEEAKEQYSNKEKLPLETLFSKIKYLYTQHTGSKIKASLFIPELYNLPDGAFQYLVQRGIKEDTINYFKVCYGEYMDFQQKKLQQRIMFPLYNNNEMVLWIGRSFLDNVEPKYIIHGKKQNYLYGDKFYEKVFLVEGVFDCLKLWQWGYENTFALLGTTLSFTQVRCLLKNNVKELVVILDGDDAGKKGMENLKKSFQRFFRKIELIYLPNGIDPDTICNKKELNFFLSNNKKS